MTLLVSRNKHQGRLSEAESACFDIARRYRRQQLTEEITNLNQLVWPPHLERLTWSEDGARFLLQCAVLVVYLPLYTLARLSLLGLRLLCLPFRYLATLVPPFYLRSPGEKNLVSLYAAFARHVKLTPEREVACIDEWIPLLYGRKQAASHSLVRLVEEERIKQDLAARQSGVMAASFRSYRTIAKERLSQQLGYYTGRLAS